MSWRACIVGVGLVGACTGPPARVVGEADAGAVVDAATDGPVLPPLPARMLVTTDERVAPGGPAIDGLVIVTFDGAVATRVEPASDEPLPQPLASSGWSSTGRYAYFIAGDPAELFVLALDDVTVGVPERVSRPLAAGVAGVLEAAFAPDGSALAYRVERVSGSADLYAVDLSGDAIGAPEHVSVSGEVKDFLWAPDSASVAFRVPTYDQDELYVAQLEGARAVRRQRVSERPPHVYGVEGNAGDPGYLWSADATRVLYRADGERHPMFEGQLNLYSAMLEPWPPSAPTRLNLQLPGIDDDVHEMVESDDGAWFAYRAAGNQLVVARLVNDVLEATEVLGPIRASETAPGRRPVFSPDSRWLAFHATEVGTTSTELFVVDLTSAPLAAVRVNTPLLPPQSLTSSSPTCTVLRFAPDSSALIYTGDQRTAGQRELFFVSLGAAVGAPQVVNGTLSAAGDVTGCPLRWSADSSSILFRAIDSAPGPNQLYIADAADLGNPRVVSGALGVDADVAVRDWAWSTRDDAIAYLADQRLDDQVELFVVGRGMGATPERVVIELPVDGDVVGFQWAP